MAGELVPLPAEEVFSKLDLTREGSELYRRDDWAYIASLTAKERSGSEPAETSVAFPASGY